jgi:hypothetical protein
VCQPWDVALSRIRQLLRLDQEADVTTIRMVDPAMVEGTVREVFEAALRRERTVFGATEISNIWRCMGHSAALLEANWNRSRALMQRGDFTPLQRELLATAVSVANACRY